MRGRLALAAEIVGGLDEAGAEDLLPHAVDGDARGERMLRTEQPLGEAEPVVFNGEDCVKLSSIDLGIRRELVLCARNGTIRRHFMGTGEALELSQCTGEMAAKPMTNCLDILSLEIDAGIFS